MNDRLKQQAAARPAEPDPLHCEAAWSEALYATRNILVPTPAQDYIHTKAGTHTAQSRTICRPETRKPV
jgi:hypothetical protein